MMSYDSVSREAAYDEQSLQGCELRDGEYKANDLAVICLKHCMHVLMFPS